MNVSVRDIFPYEEPYPEQEELLSKIIKDWYRYDVFLINAPVAFGKSAVAKSIMNLAEHHGMTSNWCVPTNELVRQGVGEFDLPTLHVKRAYDNAAAQREARGIIQNAPQTIINYYTLLANKIYKPVAIFDESHGLIPMLQDMEGVSYWETNKGYPENIYNTSQLLVWLAERADWDMKAKKMLKAMEAHPTMFTISHSWGKYRGKDRQCMRLFPLSPRNNAPILWPPSRTKKIFLMSATTHPSDVHELGLDDRRVVRYDATSPIPKAHRPLIYEPVGNMSRGAYRETKERLVSYILDKLDQEEGKGFIHATYGLAASLRGDTRLSEHPRLMWHTKGTKDRQFRRWLASDGDKVFVGSGLTEGINLKYNLCRWQIITKILYPYLGDAAIAAKKEQNIDWYVWQAVRDLLQAYGRVCRAPDDYGKTFLTDSAFAMLQHKNKDMFPKWMKEALI